MTRQCPKGHEFVRRPNSSGGCHTCYLAQQRRRALERYHDATMYLRAIKLERGCANCGYNAHHAALELDHIEPVSNSTRTKYSFNARAAVDKYLADPNIQVLCANCHRIKTETDVMNYRKRL